MTPSQLYFDRISIRLVLVVNQLMQKGDHQLMSYNFGDLGGSRDWRDVMVQMATKFLEWNGNNYFEHKDVLCMRYLL